MFFVLLRTVPMIIVVATLAVRRRRNSGDPDYHGPASTGYESGATRFYGATGSNG
ncbi:hypothetical protein ACWT_0105 [Actinoplanes sp. SE50]|uniref:hypothetical protein n=1 Tax=unclassified Actinoplanes TaxID=2626549 RepID=UPI00023ED33E|nr:MULTISPECIES: hypothetical protein [unclassified Actinoplanes]AEV81119.1 hypothetical protein ACPL_220 [Actinoplanes sp. SE50/110]ATO79520.1 hypothetical protein ACWT_0105 [Actinoplanes sp. SE50]SLL96921.1 hypothetical protein ACSP50_0110 [Actinoplanes sp. SE50/110]